jgi:hypothetical protein
MFVATQDFDQLPFNLSGLSDLSAGVFDSFVSYNEEEKLRDLLGSLFYDALVAGFNSLPALYQSGTYPIDDLVIYVADNKADIYKSLENSNTALPTDATKWEKQPLNRWARLVYGDTYLYDDRLKKWYGMNRMVVPLIYSLWTKYTFDNQTGSGIVVAAKENATVISPNRRIICGWNKFAELAGSHCEVQNTLYGFLYYSEYFNVDVAASYNDMSSYLSYEFCSPGYMNNFGL